MNPLRKLFSKLTEKFIVGTQFIAGIELPMPTKKDYLDSFRASSLVHSCTKKIGEKMSTIDFELYQLRGLKAKEQEQHELLDLLAKPNPIMSGSQLIEITSIYLSILGQCYWYKARKGSRVIELWLMRPDLTEIVPAQDGSIAYYKFTANGKTEKFPAEDVIHFKEPDTLSDYYGWGAAMSVMETIRADVYSKRWNTKFFYNSARPDAILTTEQKIGKEDREEIREKWFNKYGGWENAHRVAVLSHGLDYKQISVNQKDMDFANQRIANRDDVLMALGANKAILGITDDVNRANAEAGDYVFMAHTIKPKMDKFTDILNMRLVIDFGDDLILLNLDPTPQDNTAKDDHYVKAHNKWMTTNEIRMEEGFDPIEGGDFIYQALSLVPLGEDNTNSNDNNADDNKKIGRVHIVKIGGNVKADDYFRRKKEARLKDIYRKAMRGRKTLRVVENMIKDMTIEVCKLLSTEVEKSKEKKVVEEKKQTDEEKDILWGIFDKSLQGWEKKFGQACKSLFVKQRERALEALKESGVGKTAKAKDLELLNFEKEVKIFIKKAKPIISDIVEEAGNNALKQVGEKSLKKDFDISDPMTAEWIDKKSMKFAEEVNQTTIKKLKNTLAEGVLNGESVDQLAKRVVGVFDTRISSGSKTIARTEVLSSNNAGTNFGYKQSGVVAKKEWLATRDSKTRDSHAHADGQQVDLNEKFDVDGEALDYPGDPNGSAENIINCRCTTIPIIKD